MQNDEDKFTKVISGLKNIFKKGSKISLIKWTFKGDKYLTLTQKELNELSRTAFSFFRFLNEFAKSKEVGKRVHVYIVDNPLQSIDTDYCSPFQLFFYFNLFEPLEGTVAAGTTQTPRVPKRKRDGKQSNIKKLDHKTKCLA